MENKFLPEQIEMAKQAKSAEELAELAKENGVDITEDEAREYYEQLNKTGELSDDELDNVSGGCGNSSGNDPHINMIIASSDDAANKGEL